MSLPLGLRWYPGGHGAGVPNSVRVSALWAAGEQGLWYDPSQFDTMFQDSAGTTPVTAAGDPVGLILDKRLWQGRTRDQAAIQVAASDFTSGVDGFAAGAMGSVAAVGGELQLTSGAPNSFCYKDIATTAGKWYRTKGKLRRISGSGKVFFRAATTTFANFVSHGAALTSAAQVDVSVIYLATTSTSRFYIQQDGTGGNSVFGLDDFLLEEIPGNHASQATSAARPVLARVPFGGRRNNATRTEEFDSADYTKTRCTVTANAIAGPTGAVSADALVEDGTAANSHFISTLNYSFVSGQPQTISLSVKAANRNWFAIQLPAAGFSGSASSRTMYVNVATGALGTIGAYFTNVSAVAEVNGWYRISATVTPDLTASTSTSVLLIIAEANSDITFDGLSQASLYLTSLQCEPGSTATAYQKVTSTHDVTEAGKADCWHLSFDGSDDFLVTGNVDFSSGDKLGVFLGAHKNSDAANGAIVELSSSPGTSPGRFSIRGPDANTTASYGTFLIGASQSTFYSHTTYTAPVTNVLSVMFDIAGANRAQNIAARINAALNTAGGGSGNSGLGGGNFDNQPIYIGRRAGSTLPFNGRLFGLVIRAGIPTAAQIAAAETYMAGKTGVTL